MAPKTPLTLRAGELGDLDRIVDITLTATADQALIAYNFPHRLEFPDDNRYHWRVLLRSMFFDPNSAVVVVETDGEGTDATTTTLHDETAAVQSPSPQQNRSNKVVVAWAEWEWKAQVPNEAPPDPLYRDTWVKFIYGKFYGMVSTVVDSLHSRRDADLVHRSLWIAAKERIHRDHWSLRPRLLYLSGLYTQPSFQGLGAGGLLKEWGLLVARRNRAALGVVASHPPSVAIYKHWGFKEISVVRLQKEGESARVDLFVLLYEP